MFHPPSRDRQMLALELPPELQARLDALAAQTGRPPVDLVIEAIKDQLDDLEDLVIAEERWRDLLSGKSETIPLEEVLRRHDLAD
jgi:RHH-type transcriptional regulator, rel operon repressor / antitoxin RelB